MELGTRLKKVKGADAERFRVTVEYEDGATGQVDLSPIFGNPAGKPLVAETLAVTFSATASSNPDGDDRFQVKARRT